MTPLATLTTLAALRWVWLVVVGLAAGLVTGAFVLRRLAARAVVDAESVRRERRGLAVIALVAVALGGILFEADRRDAEAPARRALPRGARVLSEREWHEGFLPDSTYELKARMTHDEFVEWVVRLGLDRVAEQPDTWQSHGGRCGVTVTFEARVGRYVEVCP